MISIFSNRADDRLTGRYGDADARMLLEHAVSALLDAEEGLRQAQRKLEGLVEGCHAHGQAALAAEALRNLAGRRPA